MQVKEGIKISLNQEYIVSKIFGCDGFHYKLSKLGIEQNSRITFLEHTADGKLVVSVSGQKRKKSIPVSYLNNLCIVPSDAPDCELQIKEAVNQIAVSVFRSEQAYATTLFETNSTYNFNDYNFKITYLPAVDSIFGAEYPNKRFRNLILSELNDVFIGLVDFENIESELIPVIQMMDFGCKIVMVLRGYDENNEEHKKYDISLLSKMLGIPIVLYNEFDETGESRQQVLQKIVSTYRDEDPHSRHVHVNYGRQIESFISKIQHELKKEEKEDITISSRYLAISLLEKDTIVHMFFAPCKSCNTVKCFVNRYIAKIEKLYKDHIFSVLRKARLSYIDGALSEISGERKINTTSEKVDKLFTHRIWGFPIFLVFMAIMFYSTFELGKYPMQWLEMGIDWLANVIQDGMSDGFWKDMLIEAVIGGVGGVLVFIPNIFILFFFIGLLENTGYMSRVAFVADKYMHKIGLHGKSFIPMIMGFGCSVPAIMSTKILEDKRDRILTMMIVPFMSCSARLPVYILMIAAFFPDSPVLILALVYLVGILMASLVSKLFSKTILKPKDAPYVMELMPYTRPTLRILLSYMWNRGKEYLRKIAGIILIGSIIIWLLGYFPRNVEYSKDYKTLIENATTIEESEMYQLEMRAEKDEKSYIGRIGHFIEPVMRPLGFDWKMSVSILTGITGKEITVSTMGVLYQASDSDDSSFSLQEKLKNEKYMSGDRAGENVFNKVVALSFIFFVLIYFPCLAAITAIWKVSKSIKWAAFSAIYSTIIAWLVSFGIYQIGMLII